MADGRQQFQLSFQISPIALVGGVAGNLPGGVLPLLSILQPDDFEAGILQGGDEGADLDRFFAQFEPAQGSTLIDNEVATYPFANQAVAANAIIVNPLKICLIMHCPAQTAGSYQSRSAIFANLQAQLGKHAIQGGLYNIATPAFWYTNCILTSLRDITDGDSKQPQAKWLWEFIQPLVTQSQAQAVQNSLMAKVSNGGALTGDPPTATGTSTSVGFGGSLQSPSLYPAGQSLASTSIPGASSAPTQ